MYNIDNVWWIKKNLHTSLPPFLFSLLLIFLAFSSSFSLLSLSLLFMSFIVPPSRWLVMGFSTWEIGLLDGGIFGLVWWRWHGAFRQWWCWWYYWEVRWWRPFFIYLISYWIIQLWKQRKLDFDTKSWCGTINIWREVKKGKRERRRQEEEKGNRGRTKVYRFFLIHQKLSII